MKQTVSKFTFLIGALTAVAASTLWATFWWRWVAREYEVSPTGSKNLEHAIFIEIGGTLFVGFAVFWLFRRIVSAVQKTQPPTVSPTDVVRYLVPRRAEIEPTSNPAIAYLMLRSAVNQFVAKAAFRFGRIVRKLSHR